MESYLTKIFGMAVTVAPLVTIFLQLLKSAIPEKFFPPRLYPTAALLIGVLISMFLGNRVGVDILDSAAVGFIATVIAIFGFKYGKTEEIKSKESQYRKMVDLEEISR